MSQAAPSDSPVSPNAEAADSVDGDEVSGRFKIDAAPAADATVTVPSVAEPEAPPAASPEEVQSLAETELEVITATEPVRTPSLRVSMPPPVPLVALTKSSAPKAAPLAESVLNLEPALEPLYRGLSPSERAEPQVDDLSFSLDNPFARSSLVPPPKEGFPWRKVVIGTLGAVALTSAGYLVAIQQIKATRGEGSAPAPAVVVAAPAAAPAPAAVVPSPAPVPAVAPAPAAEAAKPESTAPVAAAAASSAAAKPALPAAQAAKKLDTDARPASDKPVVDAKKAAEPVAEAKAVTPSAEPAAEAPAAPEEVLPETPTRDEIMASFEKVRSDIETCAEGGHGIATTNVTISGASGRVTYAVVDGAFAGTPQGSCMARAVRSATFPRFSQPSFKVSYPFSL